MNNLITLGLLFLSAMFSGMTLGFFSLNKNNLLRKSKLGDKDAKKVYKIRKNGNLLLSTLLIGNTAVNTSLSIFLGSIIHGAVAVLLATALIVIFGEILPQSIFARFALKLGAKLSWFVTIFIYLLYPISFPISWILDKLLGKELPDMYSKSELIKLVEEHEESPISEIDEDEERIVRGALSFSEKKVKEIMTRVNKVLTFPSTRKLNESTLAKILKAGHSRIPIYEKDKNNIIGILYAKDLINKDVHNKTAGEVARKIAVSVEEEKFLDDLLNDFKRKRNHLFIVTNEANKMTGIVTIEDVLEEILGVEIIDEFDQEEEEKKTKKITRDH